MPYTIGGQDIMLDESVVKRLALIRYFYKEAVEQSQRPEPLCSTSILTFHDSIEFFLQLASEFLDIGRRQPSFIEYWEILASKLPRGFPTQKESMRRLNRARVALKHHGTSPSKLDIEAFRASATNFFEENTPPIFDIKFSKISLIELVQCEETKNNLKESKQLLEDNKIEDSLDKVAIAFAQLIDDYESRKKGRFGRSPFFFGQSLTFLSSFHMGIDRSQVGKLADFVDKIKESVEALQVAVKILSLRIDYRRYVKFRLLTPHISRAVAGNYLISRGNWGERGLPSTVDVQFCIDFVIESAVILQEFDFNTED